ncbi:MAG: Ig-like domain-containing protein [Lachnospiraceae bacterium]|nr:Ig-like domain-containing protein [Lachnospiraceae bacterium]
MKRITAFLLAAVLAGNLVNTPAFVTSVKASQSVNTLETMHYKETENVTLDEYSSENEELFAGYVEKTFYGNSGISFYGISAREELSASGQVLYDFLKEKIESVAKGELASTVFNIDKSMLNSWAENGVKISWTAEDLGVSSIWNSSYTGIDTEAYNAFKKNAWGQFEFAKVLDALLHDCPYDLYWFDKLVGASSNYSISLSGEEMILGDIHVSFSVVDAYHLAEDTNNLTADTTKTSAATAAAVNAQEIVDKYAELSDIDKLKAYRDEICALVSYNTDAASSSYTGGYGDPWQLIYVFDEDMDTNVVCEGYAKAFQYLCDMSDFNSSKVSCYTISGTMAGGTGAGGHMWNIVTMEDGKNYLVDITNSDEGSIGQNGGLFLSGVAGSVEEGYTFTISHQNIIFTYEQDMIDLWGMDGILVLADSDYTPSDVEEIVKKDLSLAEITVESCTYSGLAAEPAITVVVDGIELEQDIDYTIVGYENNIHAGDNASVTIEAAEDSAYTGTVKKQFTINPKTVSTPVFAGVKDSYMYTGSTIEPLVTVKDGDTVIAESEYSVSYSDNVEIGTATITITDNEGGDYVVSGKCTFEITEAVEVEEYNVLLWTTQMTFNQSVVTRYGEKLTKIYEDLSTEKRVINVQSKLIGSGSSENHFTGTEVLADSYDLVIVFLPCVALNDNDIIVLKNFVKAGGRIVLQGEFNGFAGDANKNLSVLAQTLGTNFTITDTNCMSVNAAVDYINIDSDLLGGMDLAENESIIFRDYANIAYEQPAEVIASYKGIVGIVDQAVDKGRITIMSDFTFWISNNNTAVENLFLRYLLNSSENKDIVEDGGNPNEGFGGTCGLAGSIAVADNQWTEFLGTDISEYFHALPQTVTVTARDKGCGLDKVYAYISDTELPLDTVEALTEEEWEELELTDGVATLEITPDNAYVVYVKITDLMGNTEYISSEKVVLDATAPVISGINEENSYCDSVAFTVQDTYLEMVTVDGIEVIANENGEYSFDLNKEEHIVKAVDKAGNEAIITVKNAHTWVYTASENVITANCSNTGCEYETTGLTLTLNAKTPVVYDKLPYGQISVENKISSVTGEAAGEILYYIVDENKEPIGEAFTEAPSAVGNYMAAISLGGQMAKIVFEIVDASAPTGSIAVEKYQWIDFLENPVFEIFFAQTQTVLITAEDEGSGLEKVCTYVSNTALTLDEVKALTDNQWKQMEITNGMASFDISPDNAYVIYAKITDKAGNAAYISTDGIVLDATAPVIRGIEAEKTYCKSVTFTVEEEYLETVTVDGTEIKANEKGEYTFELVQEEHIVEAADKAGNKKNVTVKNAHTWVYSASENVITANCSNTGCEYETTGLTLTLNAKTPIVHNGLPYDRISIVNEITAVTGEEAGEILYYMADENKESIGDAFIQAPTDMGSYIAAVTLGTETAKVAFEITHAPQYTISWDIDGDGKADASEQIDYDTIPTHEPVEKAANYQYTYQFAGWTPAIEPVTQDQMYTAVFDEVLQKYTVSLPKTMLGYEAAPKEGSVSPVNYNGSYSFVVQNKPGYDIETLVVKANGKVLTAENGIYTVTSIGCDGRDVQIEITIADTTAPTGTISINTDTWSTLRKNISFDKSYTTAQNVEIEAFDLGSGVQSIFYCIADKEVEENALKNLEWLPYASGFLLSPDMRGIVYAKIVDMEGNTTYISTSGLIIEIPDDEDVWKNEEVEKLEEYIYEQTTDEDLKGSLYNKVRVRAVGQYANKITLKWNKVTGADGYIIYGNRCNSGGKVYRSQKLKTIKNPNKTSWTNKKLQKGTYYKYTVTAYKIADGKKIVLSVSKMVHAVTSGGKYKNPKGIKVKQKTITVKVGKKKKIKATRIMPKGGKMRDHVDKFRYESTNKKIATIDKKGKIKAKKPGTCYAFVYLQNGIYQRIKIKVK